MSTDEATLEHLAGTCVRKIRELEAELAGMKSWASELELKYGDAFARAEKASAAEIRIRQEKAENDLFWSAKVNKLQARVAELAKACQRNGINLSYEAEYYHEAREREEG